VASFKPAYLIHGDDHGRIAERRARLRSMAERASGAGGIEVFENETSTPEAVALAMSALTFAVGRRFIVVDGVERWKEKELQPVEQALAHIAPETTVAFFAREEGRFKAPDRLHKAVLQAGGDVAEERSVKPWELPKWVIARGRELGLAVDREAAAALVAVVGERQQRLLRELEKLRLALGEGTAVDVEIVGELAASSAERRVWALGDLLVARDRSAAIAEFLALRAQGERVSGLLYSMTRRMREALAVAEALEAGQPAAQVKRGLRMPSKAADRLIADAGRAGAAALRTAVEQLADLELDTRGGRRGGASEDTIALRAIARIAV
jgi:DNA polymerase-3 subunit delta